MRAPHPAPRFDLRRALPSSRPALAVAAALALSVASCRSPEPGRSGPAPIELPGIAARCSRLGGVDLAPEPPLTLIFEDGGHATGHTGLNVFVARYTRSGETDLRFSRIVSTRMAGAPEQMRLEEAFLEALAAIDGFRLEGGEMHLLSTGELQLALVPLVADAGFRGGEAQLRPHSDDWPPNTEPQAEWLKLNSGEWLKGKILTLTRGTLQFDSDKLDELSLNWDDVAEVHTQRPFTALFDDQTASTFAEKPQANGQIDVEGDTVFVRTEAGVSRFRREDLYRMVPGALREVNYWSAKVLLGVAVRSGNTQQTDLTVSAGAKRRSASSRLETQFDSVYGEQKETEIANNQRFVASYDVFLSRRFFVTPFGIELYRDRFQNIELRSAPYTGVGYTVFDRPDLEQDVTLAVGYRSTKFDSTPPGSDDRTDTGTINIGTSLSADLTPKVELEGSYSAQVSIENLDDTNQTAFLGLSFDFWKDFDLDVRGNWNRVGSPEPGDDGITPKNDDFRLDIGFSWSF